eukprot:7210369-Prymnesium_polylepis.4
MSAKNSHERCPPRRATHTPRSRRVSTGVQLDVAKRSGPRSTDQGAETCVVAMGGKIVSAGGYVATRRFIPLWRSDRVVLAGWYRRNTVASGIGLSTRRLS